MSYKKCVECGKFINMNDSQCDACGSKKLKSFIAGFRDSSKAQAPRDRFPCFE